MLQLIVSDMDGTLLNEVMSISQSNVEAIRAAEKQGASFMVATGRGYTEAKPLLEKAGLSCPLISLNGGQIFNEEGEVVKNIGLTKDSVRSMVNIIEEAGLYYEMTTSKGIFSNNKAKRIETVASLLVELNPDTSYKMAVILASARLEVMNIHYIDDYSELIEDDTIEIIKVIVFSEGGQPVLQPLAKQINKTGELAITSSFENNIEINHINAQKGIAVKEFAKDLNIPLENIMTIGDNNNDLSMLEVAGYSFAMGNGTVEAKAAAKYTTSTNNENGVGEAIMRVLNNNL
ncbi:Cof-type HAD-IIB family hydrolase [Pisciglobus halotolerans]|uniref:Cof subfamily of IIB subfamily of haloacid dehalogenase superfamily/HAD-superfamily hydrolase, subfamily IIB n=1 Tax=Pisciglobus halotolerans TaxID=745365 RepID=A0A1I3B1P4_9LACT|nr:Cof-type HAD-IIB family hydrolase [Pisciglobus halotolerans]SFH56026.1 hypothetical protein SAMN04489868_10316 [Pisciglobus halotolerans]